MYHQSYQNLASNFKFYETRLKMFKFVEKLKESK
jgi:hypothetical protein